MGPFDDNNLQKAIAKLKQLPQQKCLTFKNNTKTKNPTATATNATNIDLLKNITTKKLKKLFTKNVNKNLKNTYK